MKLPLPFVQTLQVVLWLSITAHSLAAHAWAQSGPLSTRSSTAGDKPSFEVASIKPNHSGSARSIFSFPPGSTRFTATNLTTKDFIQFAYYLQEYQLSKGPNWIYSTRYDIDAKLPDATVGELQKLSQFQQMDQVRLMLQSLLADRFMLKVNRETKEVPVYILVVARDGPKLTETAPISSDDANLNAQGPPRGPRVGITGRGQITGTGVPVSLFADILSRQLGRKVLDRTGIKGNYDFKLQWTPDESQPSSGAEGNPTVPAAPASDSSEPAIFTAIQEQLGLKLQSQKGPVEILVIDRIEQPSEN